MVTFEELAPALGYGREITQELEAELNALNGCAYEHVLELVRLCYEDPQQRTDPHIELLTGYKGYKVRRQTATAWMNVEARKKFAAERENAQKHLDAANIQAESAQKNERTAKIAMRIAGAIMLATIVQAGIAFFEIITEKSPVYTISLQEAASAPTAATQ